MVARMWIRIVLILGALVVLAGLAVAVAAGAYVFRLSRDLPSLEVLARYEPPITSRVHAGDGKLIAEYARERRLFVPMEAVPQRVVHAFLSAEDKNFYTHRGVDPQGILRGAWRVARNKLMGVNRLESGSTITQQVAKNFLLTNEQTIPRKVREMLIALRMEKAFNKDQILELYLNEIYFGARSYGVSAAALTYFDKALDELTLEEAAYLAALPKGPNNYHPVRDRDRAVVRRNWVLDQMLENGFVTRAQAEAAQAAPLEAAMRSGGVAAAEADWFAEEIRRRVADRFGEDALYNGGLSVRTTVDTELQAVAQGALRDGLETYAQRRGWRGPIAQLDLSQASWTSALSDLAARARAPDMQVAVVTEVTDDLARVTLEDGALGALTRESAAWAVGDESDDVPTPLGDVFVAGDVIQVGARSTGDSVDETSVYALRQPPRVEGAVVALDPRTGRVLALVGGYDFGRSQFNRAVQARRQPGSAFKPFVYAAALDNGYTPSSIILDAPFAAARGDTSLGFYKPSNYTDRFYGPSTLRTGIEKSRNVMTVRLAQELGMDPIRRYARALGVVDDVPAQLSMALGAGETTPLRLAGAYAAFVNGGKRVEPVLIDRVQDRRGKTVYKGQTSRCVACGGAYAPGANAPDPIYDRPQALDPRTAYQITSMLEGVVRRGTGKAVAAVGKPLAGKTGTTNDFRDAWFVGYSPQLVVAVFVGHDANQTLGSRESGGRVASPIFRDVMAEALRNEPARPFRIPPGIRLVRVNAETGLLARPSDTRVILEAFKIGEEPTAADRNRSEKEGLGGLY